MSEILKRQDHIPLFKLRVAKEIPPVERPPNPFIHVKRQPLVLSATEFQSIRDRLSDPKSNKEEMEEKLALHQLSKNRVQHWKNTISGQRRQRLTDREQRLQEEEAERVKIDEAHAQEERRRRGEFIQRAKNLMFYEQDKIKKVHSHVLMDLVLQERDLQIKYKKEKLLESKVGQDDWLKITEAKWETRGQAERAAQIEAEQKTHDFAKHQREQHEKRLALIQVEKEQKLAEGRMIRQLDFEYNSKECERHAKRLQDQKKLMSELETIRKQKAEEKSKHVALEKQQDEKIKLWAAHKDTLEKMRKDKEEQIFSQHLKVREKIGLEQYAKLSEERNKKSAWVDMRMKQKQKEEQQKEQLLLQRKQAATTDMRKFFNEMKAHNQEQQRAKLEHNHQVAEENARVRLEIANETVAKKEKLRQKELELYESHRQQFTRAREAREKAKQQVQTEKAKFDQEGAEEIATLRKYTESLVAEPWMASNPRKHDVDQYMHKALEVNLFATPASRPTNKSKKSA